MANERLDLRIHPECDRPELVEAAAGYQRLWDAHRARIVEALRAVTGLGLAERLINAIVCEGSGFATPLRFRAHPDEEFRLGSASPTGDRQRSPATRHSQPW